MYEHQSHGVGVEEHFRLRPTLFSETLGRRKATLTLGCYIIIHNGLTSQWDSSRLYNFSELVKLGEKKKKRN